MDTGHCGRNEAHCYMSLAVVPLHSFVCGMLQGACFRIQFVKGRKSKVSSDIVRKDNKWSEKLDMARKLTGCLRHDMAT